MDIVFVGFSGGSCSTLSQPLEIINFAASRRIETSDQQDIVINSLVATVDDKPLQKTGFFKIEPTTKLADTPNPDIIYLSGQHIDNNVTLKEHEALINWLKNAYSGGSLISAVCPSQSILAAAGLLDHKSSAIHWSFIDTFRDRWPKVNWRVDDMVVEDDNILTCCGGSSSTDLALFLVYKIFGEDIMLDCVRWFLTETPRFHVNMPPPLFEMPSTTDDKMKEIQLWLHNHFSENINLDNLAKQFGMSPRTFYRKFKLSFNETPRNYLHKIKIAAARRLLETTSTSIETIGRQVGYDDTLFFRKIFKRHLSMAPGVYRGKFKFLRV